MTIHVRCDNCRKRYNVNDKNAGKRVRCKQCATIIRIPPILVSDNETTRAGIQLVMHEARFRDFEIAIGDEEKINAISRHLECYAGPIDLVFHEKISDLVHVDIFWISPTEDRPFHTLVSSGMSDLPMTVPDSTICEDLKLAELVMLLPSEWDVSMDGFNSERNYWPIRLIKFLARFPHEFDTWLGVGHSVPNGDPPSPYADNCGFSSSILLPPLNFEDGFGQLVLADQRKINFYSVMPLYVEELKFNLDFGLKRLLGRFVKHEISEVVDIHRVNTCKSEKRRG